MERWQPWPTSTSQALPLRPFSFVEVCDDSSALPLVTAHSIGSDQLPREDQVTHGSAAAIRVSYPSPSISHPKPMILLWGDHAFADEGYELIQKPQALEFRIGHNMSQCDNNLKRQLDFDPDSSTHGWWPIDQDDQVPSDRWGWNKQHINALHGN